MSDDIKISVDPDYFTREKEFTPKDFESDTTSIASRIAQGRIENGRRYQALKEDDYWSPSDEKQFEAQENGTSSTLAQARDHGQLMPPIGTQQQPSVESTSSPPPITWIPPNCVFEVDDVLKEWTWRESFDFIHIRQLLGAFDEEGWAELYKKCYENLTPGGWLEQMEFDVRLHSDDGSLKPDSLLAGWGDNFIGCSARAGRSLKTQETMRGAIEKAGFVDVHENLYKVPLGPWPKDKQLKEAGQLNYLHWLSGLEGYAMWLLTKFGAPEPWSPEEVQVYLAGVRKEIKSTSTHGYGYARRVWARKPTAGEVVKREPVD
ncbi:hypothetical protein N7532_001079 [Penicillium argentinense]|uniref:S-adenosyl-L-methionine-dependent methyltransferase n=1 Tax=Penicillium argentinense TaxID=1131581 RepID=A0A9W9G1S7_9EURO|nr:uncharacterized protein N7532_001079 [Penicillium argentinense]KAJ5110544.1 hypothetical protein N7532_001079 [Penicillium argentinense]